MQAILALEDGKVFRGKGYGAKGECYGEVVFNTSLTGYQEIFTDPSYAGQIVVLTNPEIGNYGTNPEDNESVRPYIEGLIVREFSKVSSNWRSQQVTDEVMEQFKIPVLADIDTRRRYGQAGCQGARDSKDGWPGSRQSCLHQPHLRVGDGRALALARRSGRRERRTGALPRGCLRLRHQAEHPAQATGRRLQGDGRPGADHGGGCARPEARRRVSVEWPGRSR